MDERAREIVDFWFAPEQERRWFDGGPEFDRLVQSRFGALVDSAIRGELDAWARTPRERLALVILLDQLARNVHRGDARMYAGDRKAQALALDAFDRGLDRELAWIERVFLSMPLMHSEDLAMHERLAAILAALDAECPSDQRAMQAAHAEQGAKYIEVIRRFGRFPHRNAILGRVSTPEEEALVREWAAQGALPIEPKRG
ncbi:DUF924 family protein [Sandaracinus amylolyticus]|uniref:Putative transmembrane protein n=1 Tax=Sandaracinus amylolyticus TaxID=927083 RepID=A0A0F6YLQ0_9BACT|nr:DUF924 family protein [Sandaracinus amylolyticus]AKF10132.1 Putative transmembrane protein [Sandaracinus amylolyticus]